MKKETVLKNLFSLNGQSRSGKTTQALKIKSKEIEMRNIYQLRDRAMKAMKIDIMESISLSSSMGWFVADWHIRLKPILDNKHLLLDHYLADFIVLCDDYKKSYDTIEKFCKKNADIPTFEEGMHFYLDLDYKTYKERSNRVNYYPNSKQQIKEVLVPEALFDMRRVRYLWLCSNTPLVKIEGRREVKDITESLRVRMLPSDTNEETKK